MSLVVCPFHLHGTVSALLLGAEKLPNAKGSGQLKGANDHQRLRRDLIHAVSNAMVRDSLNKYGSSTGDFLPS